MEEVAYIVGSVVLMVAVISYTVYRVSQIRLAKTTPHTTHHIKGSHASDSLHWFKETLFAVKENPHLEKRLINEMAKVFASHKVSFHSNEYLDLISQCEELLGKNDRKSKKEIGKILELKKQCIEKMPKITPTVEKSYSFMSHNDAGIR